MGVKRIVDISFWTDNKVDDFSPEDKYFMLYLLTNPFTTQLGIYEISVKQASFQMGYSVDAFNVLLDRFESKYDIIIYSKATGEIAIKNFLRHSIMKGGKPVEDCIKKEMSKVKDRRLISEVFNYIKDKDDLNETVKKIINEYEIENHNENDNDNEVSYHDSTNDSSSIPKKSSNKPSKHKYGEYQNVKLTDSEFEKLASDYGEALRDKAISFLDEYIEEKGYKSKSHNLAIRRWVIDAVKEKEQKESKGRKEIVPDWMKKKQGFNDFKQSTTDAQLDDMEKKLMQEVNNKDFQERAEKLKAELKEKYGKKE